MANQHTPFDYSYDTLSLLFSPQIPILSSQYLPPDTLMPLYEGPPVNHFLPRTDCKIESDPRLDINDKNTYTLIFEDEIFKDDTLYLLNTHLADNPSTFPKLTATVSADQQIKAPHDIYSVNGKKQRRNKKRAPILLNDVESIQLISESGEIITSEMSVVKSRYICTYEGCVKSFSTSGHVSRHERIHRNVRPHKCDYPGCNLSFSRPDNKQQHLKTHIPKQPKDSTVKKKAKISNTALDHSVTASAQPVSNSESALLFAFPTLHSFIPSTVKKENFNEQGLPKIIGKSNFASCTRAGKNKPKTPLDACLSLVTPKSSEPIDCLSLSFLDCLPTTSEMSQIKTPLLLQQQQQQPLNASFQHNLRHNPYTQMVATTRSFSERKYQTQPNVQSDNHCILDIASSVAGAQSSVFQTQSSLFGVSRGA